MWRADLRGGAVVAATELRSMGRRLAGNRRRLAGVGLGLLQFAVVFPLFAFGIATSLGRSVAAGDPPLGTLGIFCGVAWLAGAYMGGASAINQNRIGSVGPLVRTSTPPRAVTLGRMASELVQIGVMFVPPIVVGLIEVGIGAGGPVVPVLLGAGIFTLMLSGVFVGRTVGGGLRYAGALSRLSTWGKIVAFVVVMAAVFLGTQALIGAFLPDYPFGVSASLPPLLPGRPLRAYAAVFLWPAGAAVRPVGALAAVAVIASIPACAAAAARIETALLLRDDDGDDAETATTREVPAPFARPRSGRIAWRHLLRTVRDPKSLAHAFPLVAGVVPGSMFLLTSPEILTTVGPPIAVGLGGLVAGTTYCLNPLGDDREQLPLVLTSVASPAPLLRGRVIAGSALGLVPAVAAVPVALLGPEPIASLAVVAVAPVIVPAAAGAALGLGALSPQFERREYVNVERAHPSQTVLMGYLFGGGTLFVGGSFGLWLALGAALDGELSPPLVAAAWVLGLAVLAALGIGGYVYAVRRFEDLTLDDV